MNEEQRKGRVTPENIVSLAKDEVFVFGSNEGGIHGSGAAKDAKERFQAEMGVGYGPTGQCFAIPTKNWNVSGTLPLPVIECYAARFIEYAMLNPKKKFLVTQIGCGLAGYNPEDIAPFFAGVDPIKNISLPQSFWNVIDKVYLEDVVKWMTITNDGEKNEVRNVS